MIVTKIKRRRMVVKVEIRQLERFKTIEIRLPSNVTRITAIAVTASSTEPAIP
jgi:hypothetical protein